jgi:hypothetical protein
MAAKKQPVTAGKSEPVAVEIEEPEREIATPLLDSLLENISEEELAGMEAYLDGRAKKAIGPNIACNGFVKKWAGVELIGRVVNVVTRASQLDPQTENEILFVEGIASYAEDAKTKAGKVHTKKGRYHGVFGFQLDAGTMALSGTGRGARVHLRIRELTELSGGRTRWLYDFVRTA